MKIIKPSVLVLFFACITVFMFDKCRVIHYQEQIPTYIHIDSFGFVYNNSVHPLNLSGSNALYYTTSHYVSTVWAYYNNNPVGAFDLPATIPILANDSGTLQLQPGIDMDGLNDFLTSYPFYEFDTFSFNANPGKIITHEPNTRFFNNVALREISYFDQGLEGFGPWGVWNGADISVLSNSSLVFQGRGSGQIQLNRGLRDTFSIDTSASFPIAYDSSSTNPAFIELNYLSTMPFSIGIKGNLAGIYDTETLISLYPSPTWQKVYLQVTDFVQQFKATSYNLYIYAGLLPDTATGSLYIDNVQLVTY